MPERALLLAQTGVYALSGRWLMTLLNVGVLAHHAHRASQPDSRCEAAEMFSALPRQKRSRLLRLGVYAAMFALIIVRCAPLPRLNMRAHAHGHMRSELTRRMRRLVEDAIRIAATGPVKRTAIPGAGSVRPSWERSS